MSPEPSLFFNYFVVSRFPTEADAHDKMVDIAMERLLFALLHHQMNLILIVRAGAVMGLNKNWLLRLGAIAALFSIAGCTQMSSNSSSTGVANIKNTSNAYVVRYDPGGLIMEYAIRLERFRKSGKQVRFSGRCDSACTMFLALPSSQTCIVPGATFGFHKPFGSSVTGNAQAERFLMLSYPSWVRNWVRERGGFSKKLLRMDYVYARRHLRTCPASDRV